VEASSLAPDANIKDTLSLDSLSLVDLVALVQQTYKVKITIMELKDIQTFNNLYDYILNHLPQE
jgi:acyl carrier protein